MPLSSKDYKAILEIIEIAHSIPDRTAMFRAVCEKIEGLIGISSASFMPVDPITKNFIFPGPIPYNAPLKPAIYFCLYYAPTHPLIAKGIHKAPHETIRLTDIVPASRLEDTEYGHDFQPMIPIFYGLHTMLGSEGYPIGGIGLFRKRHDRDFSDRDKEIMNILAPHLSRAFHNITLMEEIALSNGIGMIKVGNDGMPLYMNDEAKGILKMSPPLSLSLSLSGNMPDPGSGIDPAFFKTNNEVFRVKPVASPFNKGKIILLEPIPSEYSLKSRLSEFGLSKREEGIAILVVKGLSGKEIAGRLFIQEQTVRDHLRHIFVKMKIHSRRELTARVMGFRNER